MINIYKLMRKFAQALFVITGLCASAMVTASETNAIIALQSHGSTQSLVKFNLASDAKQTIFSLPQTSLFFQMHFHQESQRIALSYSPSRNDKSAQGIYLLDVKQQNPTPEPTLLSGSPTRYLFDPIWAEEGESFYYVSVEHQSGQSHANQNLQIHKYEIATESKKLILKNASRPSIAPIANSMAFISTEKGANKPGLGLLDLETHKRTELIPSGQFDAILHPKISSDGQWVYFLTPVPHHLSSIFSLFINNAYAHPGKKHAEFNWWKLNTQTKQLIDLKLTVGEIRSAAWQHNEPNLVFSHRRGISAINFQTLERKTLLKNRNFYQILAY